MAALMSARSTMVPSMSKSSWPYGATFCCSCVQTICVRVASGSKRPYRVSSPAVLYDATAHH